MKLFGKLLVFTALSLAIFPLNYAFAAGNAVVSVSVPADAIEPGEQFSISIHVDPNNEIAGMQFNLSFDPSVVTANSITEGSLLGQGGASTYFNSGNINNQTGTISGVFGVITSPGQSVSASGSFALINMTAGSANDESLLSLANVIVGNVASQAIPVTTTNGMITIESDTDPDPAPAPPGGGIIGGGGGGGGGGPAGITSLSGSMTSTGVMVEDVTASDVDKNVELVIPRGTIVKNRVGQLVSSIRITPRGESQAVGSESKSISDSYEIEPSGTTFDASATLIFKYSHQELPADVSSQSLYIALWDPESMTWQDLGGVVNPDSRTVSIPLQHLSVYALMAHSRPASFALTGFNITPEEVSSGEAVTASIQVDNTGDLMGTYEAVFKLNGEDIETREVTLSGGDSDRIEFTFVPETAGQYTASVGNEEVTFQVREPLSPAIFTLSGLNVNPLESEVGEPVNIETVLNNTGETAGTGSVTLLIDGIAYQTQEIFLEALSGGTISFTYVSDSPGMHTASIGDMVEQFEIKSPEPLQSPVTGVITPEVSSVSATPAYEESTSKLIYARIAYQMNENWESLQDASMVLSVLFNGQLLEQVPMLTLSQLQPDGKTGELSYVPADGWTPGEYSFQAELYQGDNLVQNIPVGNMNVSPESIGNVVSWKTLGIIIGATLCQGLVIVLIVLYFRRDKLRDYWK